MKNLLIFSIVFFSAVMAGAVTSPDISNITVGTFLPKVFTQPVETTSVYKPQTLSFVGDVMLGRQVEMYLKKYGAQYVYSGIPSVSSTTILVGNFEAPIPKIHTQTPDMTFSFSVDEKYISAMSDFGFQYMSLANNHTFDKGAEDFANTQQVLEDNDIGTFGEPKEFSTTSIRYVALEGGVVALVGLHTLQSLPTESEISNLITEASKHSDLQIAYMHWGNEYELVHSKVQQRLAHTLVDAGFDSVIGNHPHVVQDIEMYKDAVIFYSLGNFIFDQYFSKDVQEGLWLDITIQNGTLVYGLKGVTSIGSRTRPRFMAPVEDQMFLDALAKRSSPELIDKIKTGEIGL